MSKMAEARDWHWIRQSQLSFSGIAWKPLNNNGEPITGRSINHHGYVVLTRRGMSAEDEALCRKFELFRGSRKTFVREHHLVAVKKYGIPLNGLVVRHLNGVRSDNRPENIVTGTTQENTMDHNTARLMCMFWRNKYESLLSQVRRGEAKAFIKRWL